MTLKTKSEKKKNENKKILPLILLSQDGEYQYRLTYFKWNLDVYLQTKL